MEGGSSFPVGNQQGSWAERITNYGSHDDPADDLSPPLNAASFAQQSINNKPGARFIATLLLYPHIYESYLLHCNDVESSVECRVVKVSFEFKTVIHNFALRARQVI